MNTASPHDFAPPAPRTAALPPAPRCWGAAFLPQSYRTPAAPPQDQADRLRRWRRVLLAGCFLLIGVTVWLSLQLIHERHLARELRHSPTASLALTETPI